MNTTQESASEYNNIARFILIGFLFLQPLIINPFGWNIYLPLRVLLLYSIATFLLLFKINQSLKSGQFKFYNIKALRWLVMFILSLVLSTIFSIHLPSSIYGNYPRFEGLFTWLSYIIIFFFVVDYFSKERETYRLIKSLSLASILVSIYGLLQFLGYDFIAWGPEVVTMKRSFSFLGNPINLGIYFVLVMPINLQFALLKKSLLFIIASLLNLVVLVMTFSIGPWIAFMASFVTLMVINRNMILGNKKIFFGLITAVICVLLLIMFLATPVFKFRFNEIVTGRGSFKGRLLVWKDSLPAFIKRPVFGSGPDTFYLAFTQNLSPQYERMVSRRTLTDRAHNELIQMGLSLGIIGLVAYLGLLFSLFSEARIALRQNKNDFYTNLLKATLAGAIGYIVAMQTFFGAVDVTPLFWAILGLLAISSINIQNIKLESKPFVKSPVSASFAFTLIIIALMSFPLTYGLRLVLGDYYYRQAKLAFRASYVNDSFYFYKKATTLVPFNTFYKQEYARSLMEKATKAKDKVQFQEAITIFKQLNRINPMSSFYYFDSGHAYLEYYKLWPDKRYLYLARQKYNKGLGLDENYSQMRYELALVELYLGNKEAAKENISKVLETRPDIVPADFRGSLAL